jgi:signal transduction histidine kinase
VESRTIVFNPEHVKVDRIVAEVCEAIRPLAASRGLTLESFVAPDVLVVFLDPTRLKQVLYNYLSNAVKFTPGRGKIAVRVEPEGIDRFRIEVQDTGIGINPEDQRGLFTEFQQVDAGTGKQYQGTGLGLALTKKIVEAQCGEVGLVSAAGRGSTFYAILPRGREPLPDGCDNLTALASL